MDTSEKLVKVTKVPAIITALLLLVPLSAKLLTDDMGWSLFDFIFAGVLLFGTGFSYKLITIQSENFIYKAAVAMALVSGLFLIWVNGAVGIIGSENNPVNSLYFGVVFVGIIGAIISRFQPRGLELTMFWLATAQALVTAIALIGGYYQSPPSSVFEILAINGFFITLFAVSAMLFRYAGQEQIPDNVVKED